MPPLRTPVTSYRRRPKGTHSPEALSRELGVSAPTIRRWILRGIIDASQHASTGAFAVTEDERRRLLTAFGTEGSSSVQSMRGGRALHRPYLTPRELATQAELSTKAILRRCEENLIPAYRPPGTRSHWKIPVAVAQQFLASLKTKNAG